MKRTLIALAILVTAATGLAQGDLEARVAELEQRVAQLEAMLEIPPPPPTTQQVGGFTFSRVAVSASSSNYTEVVGQISADSSYATAEVRAVLYASDGSILGTTTLFVDNVGAQARTFNTLLRNVDANDVQSVGFEIEGTR